MKKSIFVLAILVLVAAGSASAHEHQAFKIGNKVYEFTVGSLNEPIAVDDKTGVDLRVREASNGSHDDEEGTPVTGLDQTLKVELIAGGVKKTLDLTPAFGEPGAYRAHFIPTVQTTISYRLFGTINNTEVDLTFTCNPAGHPRAEDDMSEVELSPGVTRVSKSGAFGCAIARADLGFPEPAATGYDMNQKIGGLDTRLADLSTTSRNFTYTALGLGILGTILGAFAIARKKRELSL